MSENKSPANEVAPAATQPAAMNQDNASVTNTNPTPEATSNPSSNTSEANPESKQEKPQPAKKEPKQGVRDTRTIKTPENSDPSASDPTPDSKPNGKGAKKDGGQLQQNNANNNRRGRRGRKSNEPNQNQTKQKPVKLNAKAVSKKAWKIFLAEVGEEGLALIGDKEGKDLTKRSFRLAEIFQEEEQRRVQLAKNKNKDTGENKPEEAKPAKKKQVRAKKATKKSVKEKAKSADDLENSDAKSEPKTDIPAEAPKQDESPVPAEPTPAVDGIEEKSE